jgi:hypothetical protein
MMSSKSAIFPQTDIFPSKEWNPKIPKTCLCDDTDLLETLKLLSINASKY